jgi:hypothetical protein
MVPLETVPLKTVPLRLDQTLVHSPVPRCPFLLHRLSSRPLNARGRQRWHPKHQLFQMLPSPRPLSLRGPHMQLVQSSRPPIVLDRSFRLRHSLRSLHPPKMLPRHRRQLSQRPLLPPFHPPLHARPTAPWLQSHLIPMVSLHRTLKRPRLPCVLQRYQLPL